MVTRAVDSTLGERRRKVATHRSTGRDVTGSVLRGGWGEQIPAQFGETLDDLHAERQHMFLNLGDIESAEPRERIVELMNGGTGRQAS